MNEQGEHSHGLRTLAEARDSINRGGLCNSLLNSRLHHTCQLVNLKIHKYPPPHHDKGRGEGVCCNQFSLKFALSAPFVGYIRRLMIIYL